MARSSLGDMLLFLRKTLAVQEARDLTDGELLRRFVTASEDAAFAVLVHRHGPMVLSVCQRVLADAHAAEDAFQATFMVLVRRAKSIRKQAPLANWLYAVAQRIAMRARSQSATRRRQERSAALMPPREQLDEPTWQEVRSVLDEEIVRLPRKYRAPIVLCYLEGKTHEQAAKEMGWVKTTLTSRLARGRELLRQSLVSRGITLSGAALTLALAEKARAASVAAKLTLSTVKAAATVAAGKALAKAGLSAGAIVLTEEAMKAAFWCKLQMVALVALLGLAAGGAGMAGYGKLTTQAAPAIALVGPASSAQPIQMPLSGKEKEQQPALDPHGDPLPDTALARLGTVRFRSGPGSMTFVPKTNVLVSTSQHFNSVRTWDTGTGRVLRQLEGPGFGAFSADGRLALTGRLGVVDFSTGKTLRKIDPAQAYSVVALSPDGKIAARGGHPGVKDPPNEHKISLWDTTSGKELRRLEGHADRVLALVFSPDGKVLASGSDDKTVRLWEVETGRALRQLGEHTNEVLFVRFAPGGKFLASGDALGTLRIWDLEQAKLLHELRSNTKRVRSRPMSRFDQDSAAYSPDGQLLACGGANGSIVLWDPQTGKEVRQWAAHGDAVTCVSFSSDGKILASAASDDNAIRLWDVVTGNQINQDSAHTGTVHLLRFGADGKTLVSGGGDLKMLQWEVASAKEPVVLYDGLKQKLPDGASKLLDFSADGKLLAVAEEQADATVIRLWDAASGKWLRELSGHKQRAEVPWGGVAGKFSPDGKYLVSQSRDATRIWEVATGKELYSFQWWIVFAFAPDSQSIYLVATGNTIRQVDLATGKDLRAWPCPTLAISTELAVSADGKFMAGARFMGAETFAGDTGKQILQLNFNQEGEKGHKLMHRALAFSPNGRVLAIAGFNWTAAQTRPYHFDKTGSIQLYDMFTGQMIRQIDGPQIEIWSLAYAPDGRCLASGGQDATILLWDLTGQSRPGRQKIGAPTAAELEGLWSDLAADSSKVDQAIWNLARAAGPTVPFLSERLQPPAADEKEISKWIADLGSDQFATRQAAAKALTELGERAEAALRKAHAGNPPLEVRQRLDLLLEKRDQDPENLRRIRAVEALEHIGTPKALAVLKSLADVSPQPRLSQAAAAALGRLAKRMAKSNQ